MEKLDNLPEKLNAIMFVFGDLAAYLKRWLFETHAQKLARELNPIETSPKSEYIC